VSKGVGVIDVISLIIYILPSFMVIAIPMSFLLAVLLTFGRLSSDEEITAVKASGISLVQMMPPVISISIITFIATLFLMIYALPWGNHSFKTKIYNIVREKADTSIVPGRVLDSFSDIILYVNEKDKNSNRYRGIVISEKGKGAKSNTIIASEAEIISVPDKLSVALRLYDGAIHKEGEKKRLRYNIIKFKQCDITLSINKKKNKPSSASKGDRELSIGELLIKVKELKARGHKYDYLMVELHKKFSIPFACIVFAFIGAPLGIQGKRSGKAHGFMFSLLLITIYYIFLMAGEALGDKGTIPPFLTMWAPNIFLMGIGLYLLNKVNNDSEIKTLSIFEGIYSAISSFFKGIFKRK
jgi:lipopolysaccharide export system permease protein